MAAGQRLTRKMRALRQQQCSSSRLHSKGAAAPTSSRMQLQEARGQQQQLGSSPQGARLPHQQQLKLVQWLRGQLPLCQLLLLSLLPVSG